MQKGPQVTKLLPPSIACLNSAQNVPCNRTEPLMPLNPELNPWSCWQAVMVCSGVTAKSLVPILLWFSSTWRWEKAQEEIPQSFRCPLQVLPAVIRRPPLVTKLVMAASIHPHMPPSKKPTSLQWQHLDIQVTTPVPSQCWTAQYALSVHGF